MRLTAKIASTAALLAFLTAASALAQGERGIIIQNRPIDVGLISPTTVQKDGVTYVPLADVARALDGTLMHDRTGDRYSVKPGQSGILEIVPDADRAGLVSPKTRPEVRETATFGIGDRLVSRGIIVIDSKPHMPLDDLAAAMGLVVEDRPSPEGDGTVPVLVPSDKVTGFLRLSERGIIIIDSFEP